MAAPGASNPGGVSGPFGERLTIPTHVSPTGGETTHPSILHIPGGWNGYEYWLAHTPYPGGDDASEDPNICASHDGIVWEVPAGLVNPLDDQPGSPNAFNSDVDLKMGPSNTMFLFWRTYDPAAPAGTQESLYYRSSTNGITWSAKTAFWQTDLSIRLLSPSLWWDGSKWLMWAVNQIGSPNTVVYLEGGGTPNSGWTSPVPVNVGDMQPGKEPWHLWMGVVDGTYVGLLTDVTLNTAGLDGDLLFIAGSTPVEFANSGHTVIPRQQTGEHDSLYRATMILDTQDGEQGYRVWYSAWRNPPPVWNLYRTFLTVTEDAEPTPEPETPVAPPMIAAAAVRDHVTWFGVHRVTGKIITELPDMRGKFGKVLSAYGTGELAIPITRGGPGHLPVQLIEPCVDGRSGAIVAVVNDLPMWMGLTTVSRSRSNEIRVNCVTPEAYLTKRFIRDALFDEQDRALVALSLIQQAEDIDGVGQGLGLEYDVTLTGEGTTITYLTTDRQQIYAGVRDLCTAGLEWEIALDWADSRQTGFVKIARIARRIGRITGTPTAMFETGDAGSVIDYELTESWSERQYANHVTAIGPGQGESQPVSTPVIDQGSLDSGNPLVELVVNGGSNINTDILVNEYASAEATRVRSGTTSLSITANINQYPRPGVDLMSGDQASYRLESDRHPGPSAMDPTDLRLVGERRMTSWSMSPAEEQWDTTLVSDPTLEAA